MLIGMGAQEADAKTASRFVTAEMRANAQANAEKYDWAAARRDGVVKTAERWAEMSDDELWALITSQWLPRASNLNEGVLYKGKKPRCPNCGEDQVKHGQYSWKYDFWKQDWKVTCAECGETYPKNNFKAFYESALDEHGYFHRELGDQSLLFNTEHPDPKDPLHKFGVDDGYGMTDADGNIYHMVAYYNQWAQWRSIYQGIAALSEAYALTGEQKYAHKCAVLLDRIADVYPEMDYRPLHDMGFQHSQGGTGQGRVEGAIWESSAGQWYAKPYDVIFDGLTGDDELVTFLSGKAEAHGLKDKSSIGAICRHIEDDLVLEILKSVEDRRINGNIGMDHVCVAIAAIALDRKGETEKWLDWLFSSKFPAHGSGNSGVPWVLTEGLDRDGMGGECGGYGLIWVGRMIELARIMANYPDYTKHDMVRDYPKLKQAFFVQKRLNCLNSVLPCIGDSGSAGSWGRTGSASTSALGYKLFRDPRLAAQAWEFSAANMGSLRDSDDIYAADPDAVINEISAIGQSDPGTLECDHFGRYGQAYVQTKYADNGRAAFIHYGYEKGHSHHDCLNIGIFAKHVSMIPDLGYPEFTGSWPKRGAWTSNTISHNTLQVDDGPSGYSPGGRLDLFVDTAPLRVMNVHSDGVYDGKLDAYKRSVLLVDVSDDDSYVLDVFRASGGSKHRLSWHGAAQTASVEGLALTKQETGTFAGPDVEFGDLSGDKGSYYRSSGFSYMYDVERSNGAVDGGYTVDWKCEDLHGYITPGREPHLRLHALSACDEVAVTSGDPPQNKKGNLRRLRYVIQSRFGENLSSQYVNVLEPYDKVPFVKSVRRLTVKHSGDENSVAAVAVELVSGATDIHINCDKRTVVGVEGGIEFDGQIAMIRIVDGEPVMMKMINGTSLKYNGTEIMAATAAYEGKVTAIDASDPANNTVTLDPPLPADIDFTGQTIHFLNDQPLDTSYDVKSVDGATISTGDITIIGGFNDVNDYASGYRYLVNPGDGYFVPNVVTLSK